MLDICKQTARAVKVSIFAVGVVVFDDAIDFANEEEVHEQDTAHSQDSIIYCSGRSAE